MQKIILYFAFVCFISFFYQKNIYAQNKTYLIKGKVLEHSTKKPIAGADVFLANTSIGTATDSEGMFVLKNIPQKSMDLVVSSIGYESVMTPINMDKLGNRSLNILLHEKSQELKAVTITGRRGEVWARNFEIFKANFLGEDEYAQNCTIKNKDELYFNFQKNVFQAYSDETLIIENKALGYILKYQLKEFVLDYNTGYFMMVGYPFFEKMKGKPKQEKTWAENRKTAYQGSAMHLTRSLYAQNWQEEGFECKRLIRHPNRNRPSDSIINAKIKKFMPKNTQNQGQFGVKNGNVQLQNIKPQTIQIDDQKPILNPQQDSLNYWLAKKKLPKMVQYLENQPLTKADSIVKVFEQDTTLRKINLKSALQVRYNITEKNAKNKNFQHLKPSDFNSILTFNKADIYLQSDGYVIENLDITYEGFFTRKKIANMLPMDYEY